MQGISGVVNETVHAFNSEFNLGNKSGKEMLQFCRPCVEKYIFSKVYDKLFAMYAIKNEELDRSFVERSNLIRKSQNPAQALEYLGLHKKFFLIEGVSNAKKVK